MHLNMAAFQENPCTTEIAEPSAAEAQQQQQQQQQQRSRTEVAGERSVHWR